MRLPQFAAQATLYRSDMGYRAAGAAGAADATIVPAMWWGYCAVLGAACLAALADAVPGDEVAACGYFYFQCNQIDA
jgi:hypothetical protein